MWEMVGLLWEALVVLADLLIETDTIKCLCLSQGRFDSHKRQFLFVQHCQYPLIEEPDLQAVFYQQWNEWCASWKQVEGKMPAKLQNHITKYSVPMKIRGVATMDQERLAYSICQAEAWTSKRAISTDDSCIAKHIGRAFCNRLQGTQSPC